MSAEQLNRRKFIRVSAGAAAGAALAGACTALPAERAYKIKRRALGKTGEQLSIVGFGGIVVMDETPESASTLVAEAIRRDINYFDVAPAYGNAEERLGPALEPYRKSVFLACKTGQRGEDEAGRELRRSLERLRTDHFDLYQFHAVTTQQDVDAILGPGGALKAALAAREKGLIRFIGFSAHSEEAALALLDGYAFDTILFPVNWVTWYGGSFGPRVLARAQQQGIGILALKALAKEQVQAGQVKKWPKCWYVPVDTPEEVALGLHFTLTQPVTAAVCPSHAELLWMMCDAAEQFRPLSQAEMSQLAEKSKDLMPIFHS